MSAQEAVEQATLAALAISLLDALMEFDPIGIRLREGFYHTTKIFVKLSLRGKITPWRAAFCTGPLNSVVPVLCGSKCSVISAAL